VIKLIFDTNFLFLPGRFHIDILAECAALLGQRVDPLLISQVRLELDKMASGRSAKRSREASLALEYAKRLRFVAVESGLKEGTDDVISRLAAEWECFVATNDRELRKRLRDISVPVIYLRERSRLELVGRRK
jgi:rRNA-processing protein FCF1